MIQKGDLPFGLGDTLYGFHLFGNDLLILEHKVNKICVKKYSNSYELLFLDLERLVTEPQAFTSMAEAVGADYVVTRDGYFFTSQLAAETYRDLVLL